MGKITDSTEAFKMWLTIIMIISITSCSYGQGSQLGCGTGETVWPMHHIDNSLYNHNSLSPGDVDKDGFTDYAVIHEGPDKYTIVFNPGKNGDVRKPWTKVVIGEGGNPEYSYFGDFDGDGNLDVVGCGGYSRKLPTGIKIFWGPDSSRVFDGSAWIDGGYIPDTKDRGHFLYIESRDINGDGATDIVAGGRIHKVNHTKAGLIWVEAPSNKSDRRDLSKWKVHDIDSNLLSGHGFVFVDIDQDGDDDIAVANADWDTSDSEERVLWYENPRTGSAKQKQPWPMHVVYSGHEFFPKPQVAVGDLDGDGLTDLCVQTDSHIFYFKKMDLEPVSWKRIVISKPEVARWVSRPTKMADINNDGKMDIVGMLIHNYGYMPSGKTSVFWMEYSGNEPGTDNWTTHVIKWSDPLFSGKPFQGEKWDHCRFDDVDKDGDLDIVGNCEEHYKFVSGKQKQTLVGVVWFENKLVP
jgi:hypothetical protein